MKKSSLSSIAFTLSLLAVCALSCRTVETEMIPVEEESSVFSASFDEEDGTKVSLEALPSLDLISKWTGGDMLDIYVDGELAKRNVPLQNISQDGKKAYFSLNLSEQTFPGKVQMLSISSEGNPVKQDGKIYANASIVRSPISAYRPPVYAVTSVPEKDRKNLSATFKHYLTYEVLHIKNTSSKEISFSLNGYDTAGSIWFRKKGGVALLDGSFKIDAKAASEPLDKSEAVTIPPQGSDMIISGYVPTGHKIQNAVLVAEIDGVDVSSSNRKTSDVTLETGHAYHLYAVWDGAELTFTGGDITDELQLAKSSVSIEKGASENVKILKGTGPFVLQSSNESVAKASLMNGYIQIDALSIGTAFIIITDKLGSFASVQVTVKSAGEYDAGSIDLGLSVRWAQVNLGASTETEAGDYYAWGEVTTKDVYNWSTYKHSANKDDVSFTKYVWDPDRAAGRIVDQKSVLDYDDDVASIKLQGNWRIPTDLEWRELREKCVWTWENREGVNGYKVQGPSGKSIFLPVTGYRINNGFNQDVSDYGIYWSNTMYRTKSTNANAEVFRSPAFVTPNYGESRSKFDGLAIRPVSAVEVPVQIEEVDLGLSMKWCNVNLGAKSIEDPGVYYAWGETDSKQIYNWTTYRHSADGDEASFTKYVWHEDKAAPGHLDQKSVLDLQDDIAHKALGGNWRMPTDRDWRALRDSCTWVWTTVNYRNGYEITGPSGKSIFLPVTGYRLNGGFSEDYNDYGIYWSNTMYRTNSTNANAEVFRSPAFVTPNYGESRSKFDGLAIRPVSVVEKKEQLEEVDLGLSVKWSNLNLGSTALEDSGGYYSWGEIKQKQVYNWSTYAFSQNGDDASFTKYVWHPEQSANGNVDQKSVLDPEDDIASRRLGHGWRIPTDKDWQALRDSCVWTWTTINYRNGYLVTSKVPGYEGKSIFLPVTGYRIDSGFSEDYNDYGIYWSNTMYRTKSAFANAEVFRSPAFVTPNYGESRSKFDGLAIRPVREEVVPIEIEEVDLGLSIKWSNANLGAVSIEDTGDYYAWGEVQTKQIYNWSTYLHSANKDDHSFTKYVWHPDLAEGGIIDQKSVLDKEDDIAYQILGEDWRIPTDRDWRALRDSCTWVWTTVNYRNGYEITGPSGKSIFLPVTGYRIDGGFSEDFNDYGIYWSNTIYRTKSTNANAEVFRSPAFVTPNYGESRSKFDGLAIRAVKAPKKDTPQEIVDLGLSVKWSNLNLGAENTEDPGEYYAWGEVEEKQVYNWSTYRFSHDGDDHSFSKYVWHSDKAFYGYVDQKSVLEPEDDIVSQKLGGNWRMPTDRDWRALRDSCTWVWTTVNYRNGYKVTGPSGKSIFIPVTGYRINGGFSEDFNDYGIYWSNTMYRTNSTNANAEVFRSPAFVTPNYGESRSKFDGLAIRPVYAEEKTTTRQFVDLGLSVKWCNKNIGAKAIEDTGNYYAWGEMDPKKVFSLDTYKYYSDGKFTKYVWANGSSYNEQEDEDIELAPIDDVPSMLLGYKYRIPSAEQWQELREKCKWTWTTINYRNGYKVTGPNGNWIFLPTTGYRLNDGFVEDFNDYGFYWSRSLSKNSVGNARTQVFRSPAFVTPIYEDSRSRADGNAIRAVLPE